jgi:hypothetical protein
MALDTGHAPLEVRADPDWKDVVPSITDASTLGDGLRIAREHTGRSLAELAAITRVPSRYLIALEQNDFSTLPNRVFSIGYVRSYAGALGLDEQLAVERFKRESPDPSVPLQAPVGVAFEEVRRYSPRLIMAGLAVVVAVVGWNVFQRVSLMQAPKPSDIAAVPESWTLGNVPGQDAVLRLSRPRQPAVCTARACHGSQAYWRRASVQPSANLRRRRILVAEPRNRSPRSQNALSGHACTQQGQA